MSSTPFTLIEGAYALPRLRPLAHLPEPFGRDWSLLRVGERWRAELEMLYAALLRTVCIDDHDLLSYGQWVKIDGMLVDERRVTAKPATKPVPRGPTIAMVHNGPRHPVRVELKPRAPGSARRRAARHRQKVIGSVCALGCLAAFAWFLFGRYDDLAYRQIVSNLLKPVQALMARGEAPVASPRSNEVASRDAAAVGATTAQTSPVAPVHADVAPPAVTAEPGSKAGAGAESASVRAPVSASVREAAPRTALTAETGNTADTRSQSARQAVRPQTQTPRQPAYRYAADPASHEYGLPHATRSHARPEMASAAKSAAKNTASAAQSWANDDYASVTTSAALHLHDTASLPRAAASNAAPASSTEWMNHLSQRRVTEIPDQFAH
ncbi:hypothetical protein [Paraburkholderia antibiotica]|uniref:Uncharacterized protein n=1 Tax=Paraburkholderia antibiotica TaxID=2728839 RepID=A0A7X9ZV90_9BURK|nr:hypothetical protein [Paraburkholderia antibiotica]NML29436.1 hypothetical protein [Paraburkholderia antibiotica]